MRHILLCATMLAGASAAADAAVMTMSNPFVGVTHHRYVQAITDTDPTTRFIREIVVDTLEIDLAAPGVNVFMQGPNTLTLPTPAAAQAQGVGPFVTPEVVRSTTRNFVNSVGAQIGINGDFYSTAIPGTGRNGNPEVSYPTGPQGQFFADVIYTAASNGVIYSNNNGANPIFNVGANRRAAILTGSGATGTVEGKPLYNAIGGNQRLLTNGRNTAPVNDSYTTTLNPHSALGVSRDGRRIYLMTVDGRQTDYSEGMRTDEMADLLRFYGAHNAINVDGGGSTTLVMDDSNDGIQNARVVNSPSDGATGQTRGVERTVANNLAVFARHTPAGYTPLPNPPRAPVPQSNRLITSQTLLDNFDDPAINGGLGRLSNSASPYGLSTLGSGSNRGVGAASSVAWVDDAAQAHAGRGSARITITQGAANTNGFKLRALSGGNVPRFNVVDGDGDPNAFSYSDFAMGKTGWLGFWVKLTGGTGDLWGSVLVDDGAASATGGATNAGLERARFQQITNNGQWQLIQWDLANIDDWFSFASGDGAITGPNAFIDAFYFSSAASTATGPLWSGNIWIDSVVYNPNGMIIESEVLNGLTAASVFQAVPAPASLALFGIAAGVLLARRAARR